MWNGEDPAEIRDANSLQWALSVQVIPAVVSVAACDGTILKNLFIVLAEARRSPLDSPRSAREFAWLTRHPYFASRGMIDVDAKFTRFVLLVARHLGGRMHREARHVFRLRLLECLRSRSRR